MLRILPSRLNPKRRRSVIAWEHRNYASAEPSVTPGEHGTNPALPVSRLRPRAVGCVRLTASGEYHSINQRPTNWLGAGSPSAAHAAFGSAAIARQRVPDGPGAEQSFNVKQQVSALFAARVIAAISQAMLFVVLARSISPADFGALSAIIATTMVLAVVADFGAPPILARAVATESWDLGRAVLRLNRLTTAALATVLIPSTAMVASHLGLSAVVGLVGLAMALDKNAETQCSVPIAQGSTWLAASNVVLRRVPALITFVGLSALTAIGPIVSYVCGVLVAQVAGQIQCAFWMRLPIGPQVPLRSAIRSCAPFFVSNVAGQARNLDVPIVAAAAGQAAGGIYSAASRLSGPLLLLPGVLATIVLPHSSNASWQRARRLGYQLTLLHVAFTIATVPFAVLADDLIEAAFGSDYDGAGTAFALLLLGIFPSGLASVLGGVLQGQRHERFVAANGVSFAALTILAMCTSAVLLQPEHVAAAILIMSMLKSASLLARLNWPAR